MRGMLVQVLEHRGQLRVLSLATVLHNRYVASISVHGVGHGLQTAVRKGHVVLAISMGTISAPMVAKVVACVV